MTVPLGWLQLKHKPLRLLVALAGIGFAVLLILMQLGFRAALFESAVRFHERFDYDIALFSPDSVFIVRPQPFSIRRLYQAFFLRRPDSGGLAHWVSVVVLPHRWDASRISAAIPSGVGFLGAGLIFKEAQKDKKTEVTFYATKVAYK